MAGENVPMNITQEHITENGNTSRFSKDDEKRVCPLCQSPIRLFYINFNDKFLMCENIKCEFPFGHEELQIVKPNEGAYDNDSFSFRSTTDTAERASSLSSGKTWSDIERLNRVLDSEDLQSEHSYSSSIKIKQKEEQDKEDKIMKHVNDIRELNEELLSLNEEMLEENPFEEECPKIKNEKWIKNLKSLQEMSGVQLLKPEEMGLLKKEEPVLGLGELKIDIGPGSVSNVPSIRIEIHNTGQHNTRNSAADEPVTTDKPKGKDPLPV